MVLRLLAAAVAAAVEWCGVCAAPLLLGGLFPLGGPTAAVGANALAGAVLAVDAWNGRLVAPSANWPFTPAAAPLFNASLVANDTTGTATGAVLAAKTQLSGTWR